MTHLRTYSSVHCRRQSVSCCSRSSVEQSSIAHHRYPLFPSSTIVLNNISSHFLILLSDSSLICSVPVQRLVILDTIIAIRCNIFNTHCVSGCFPRLADCHLDSQSQVICISSVLTDRLCICTVPVQCAHVYVHIEYLLHYGHHSFSLLTCSQLVCRATSTSLEVKLQQVSIKLCT